MKNIDHCRCNLRMAEPSAKWRTDGEQATAALKAYRMHFTSEDSGRPTPPTTKLISSHATSAWPVQTDFTGDLRAATNTIWFAVGFTFFPDWILDRFVSWIAYPLPHPAWYVQWTQPSTKNYEHEHSLSTFIGQTPPLGAKRVL
jgi:hypothetical protein